ncbi:MAG: ATP-binding cassette domain-containing protein [Bacteroidales bacterium]|nr:ATP-binding cassette domain-containing protein [Bacteroidales bacterium]
MNKEKVIEVIGLGASFDDTVVLSDVTFSACKGDITVVLGASGSGKSTVLNHLLGLIPVEKGYVSVLGKDISNITEAEQLNLYLQMGVFYQSGALLNSMTVGENVALPLKQHSNLPDSLIEEIVYMKLGLVHLQHAFHLYPSQLSGGMLKRAALARAIVMDPPLLFCDEPGAGLDPVSLASLDELIVNLQKQLGISVVLVTHEVTSIMRIADRIVFLDNGIVVFEGSLKNALESDIDSVKQFFSVINEADRYK